MPNVMDSAVPPVALSSAAEEPPSQNGQAKVRIDRTAQVQGQNRPRGGMSRVIVKNERPVTRLYFTHSITRTVSTIVEIVMIQNRLTAPWAARFGISIVSPPPTEIPKLMAIGPKAAIRPAIVSGYGSGSLNSFPLSSVAIVGLPHRLSL